MEIQYLAGFVQIIWFTISICLLLLILKYINKKAPGLQSILDFLILDLIKTKIVHNVSLVVLRLVRIFYGPIGSILAITLEAISANTAAFVFASTQITLIIKSILIFKSNWIADISEKTVLFYSRIAILCYVFVRFWIDFYFQIQNH